MKKDKKAGLENSFMACCGHPEMGSINVVPKRVSGERKKLGTEAQQKTHAD